MKSINVMIDETHVLKGKEGRKYLEEWVNKEDLKEEEVEEEGEEGRRIRRRIRRRRREARKRTRGR
jgi:hypothetical protein